MWYDPLSYYTLGRVNPRTRVRVPYELDDREGAAARRKRRLIPLFPPPSASVVFHAPNPARLVREDWAGLDGWARLSDELSAYMTSATSLSRLAGQIHGTGRAAPEAQAFEVYRALATSGVPRVASAAVRLLRYNWGENDGKVFSEELYTLFRSLS